MLIILFSFLINIVSANEPVKVAVVDMGIAHNQVFSLSPYIVGGYDYSSKEPSRGIDYSLKYDDSFHGTFIAYLITRPYYPNSKRIQIIDMVYNDFHGYNFGLNNYIFPSNGREVYENIQSFKKMSLHLINVFNHSINLGAKVINFSSTHKGFHSDELYHFLKEQKDVFFVVSAGNEGSDLDENKKYPCSYKLDNVLCIGSVGKSNKLSNFSNYGKNVFAYTLGEYSDELQGTSFSTPIISRSIALIKKSNPNLSSQEVRKELESYIENISSRRVFNIKKFHRKYK